MKKRNLLTRNVAYNFTTHFWFAILAFFAMPYIVHALGDEAYGIMSIVSIVIGYFAFLDLGVGQAIIKYISEYYPKKDFGQVRKIMGTAFLEFIALGLFGGILIAVSTGPLVTKVFKIQPNFIALARFAFYASSLGFFINMTMQVFYAIPIALQRFDIANMIKLCVGSAQTFLTVLLLYVGYSLKEVIILNLTICITSLIIYFIVAERLLPESAKGFEFDSNTFVKLFKFGGFSSLGLFASIICVQIEKIILGIYVPISNLTYYAVPYYLASRGISFISNITSAIYPRMSELKGLDENTRYKEVYVRSSKYILIVTTFFMVIFLQYGRYILRFWIGEKFANKSTLPLQILSIGMMVNSASYAAGTAVSAAGRPQAVASLNVLQAMLATTLSLILIPKFGIIGAAMAWTLRDILLVPFWICFVNRTICYTRNAEFLKRSVLTPFMSGLCLFLISFLGLPLITNLVSLIAVLLAVFFTYLVIVYFLSLDKVERVNLKEIFLMVASRIRPVLKQETGHGGYGQLPVNVIKNPSIVVEEPITLSFFTVTYNRLFYTERMIQSLHDNTSSSYEHVIVDQGSVDGTKEYLESLKHKYPKVQWKFVCLDKNIGLVKAQDMAISECAGNLLVKIDNDARILTKDIDTHLKTLYSLIGFNYAISPFPTGLIGNLGGSRRLGFEVYYSKETDAYYTLGLTNHTGGLFRCMPASMLKKLGGWKDCHEGSDLHGEDVYICKKIRRAGFKLAYMENECVVEHQDSTLGQHVRYGSEYFNKRF